MKIPLVDLARIHSPLEGELKSAFARVLASGRFILGEEVNALERDVASMTGAAHVVGLSSGTDALTAALMALGIGPGDEVVTTPMSFFATAGCIVRLGAVPVFADIDSETFNLCPKAAASAVSDKTRVIVPVNLFGRLADLPTAKVPIVEDAAQSIGTGPPRGIAASLSFFPTKNLGAFGDGGAVLTNDPALADKITLLRSQGSRPKYHHSVIGGNFRLDALQAALLRVKLPKLREWTDARRKNADGYRRRFADLKVADQVIVPSDVPDHVYNQFVIRVRNRDELRSSLADKGISTEIYYPVPLHLQPCLSHLGYAPGSMPNAEKMVEESLAIPVFPGLTASEQDYIVGAIESFLLL